MVRELLLCARHWLTLEATEYWGHGLSPESLHFMGWGPRASLSGRMMLEQEQEREEAFQAEGIA